MDDRRRRGVIPTGRGLRLLTVLLLLPIATTLALPATGAAKNARKNAAPATVAVDSLWAGKSSGTAFGVCADPSSASSLSSCFATSAGTQGVTTHAMATDGTNVYFAGSGGGLSCPIADLGANCTHIMAGPWPSTDTVTSIAASGGQIWIGQYNASSLNGKIFRCPADLPYVNTDTMPAECVLLDDPSPRGVSSLLLANGRLYAGLRHLNFGVGTKTQALLWDCDPQLVDRCTNGDFAGGSGDPVSLAAGGGYLWAAVFNEALWRCTADATGCTTWDDPVKNNTTALSYDGAGTLYAGVESGSGGKGVVWSCPTATANSCANLESNGDWTAVAAGAGGVFAARISGGSPLSYATATTSRTFTQADSTWANAQLLYVPAGGPVGVGGARMTISAPELTARMERRCARSETTPRARIRIVGPNGMRKVTDFRVCRLRGDGVYRVLQDLLDPGRYAVRVRSGMHRGQASFTVEPDTTKRVSVAIAPAR